MKKADTSKVKLPKDLLMTSYDVLKEFDRKFDPVPIEVFGKKVAGLAIIEQLKLKAKISQLESEYHTNVAKLVGKSI